MNNQSRRIDNPRPRDTRMRGLFALAVRAILPALVIIVLMTGGVSAASKGQSTGISYAQAKNLNTTSASLPDCITMPQCAHIHTHRSPYLLIPSTALPGCFTMPQCAHIRTYSQIVNSAYP